MNTTEANSIYEYLQIVSALSENNLQLWYRGSSSLSHGLLPNIIWRGDLDRESTFVHHFLVNYKRFSPLQNLSPWEIYALMQHHGLPTRLLDWSRSPLSALYFALHQDPEINGDRVVWVLPPHSMNAPILNEETVYCPGSLASRIVTRDEGSLDLDSYLPEALDPNDNYDIPDDAIAIESPITGDRLAAQQGCFTIHGANEDGIEKQFTNEEVPSLSAIVLKTADNLQAFKEPLLSWGVDEASIYHDLDSLCSKIKRTESNYPR